MSNITDFIKYDLYPQLFNVIDKALPEFEFSQYSKGWRSSKKLDLSAPKQARKDKTVVTERAPKYLLEQGGEALPIIDYVMRRDNIELIDAVKILAKEVGLQLPHSKDYNEATYQQKRSKEKLLEELNSYFVYLLTGETKGGNDKPKLLEYLKERGYSLELIKAMELGYIPGLDRIYKKFAERYSKDQINEALNISKLSNFIGVTHRLSIPYRVGGSIKGFNVRCIGDEIQPKYINTLREGDKSEGFFNIKGIKGDKDIIIVEGELDCLHATAKGLNNVVALGGSSISSNHIEDALRRGVKMFTLCLDNDPGKEIETKKKILKAIDTIKAQSSEIYIAQLPGSKEKTDPDSYIKTKGVESFKELTAGALPYYEYWLQGITEEYKDKEILEAKDEDKLLESIVNKGAQITEPIQLDRYKAKAVEYVNFLNLGVTKESLEATIERLTYSKNKEAQSKQIKSLLDEVTTLNSSGDTAKALELLESKVKEAKLIDKQATFKDLYKLTLEEDIREYYRNAPDSLSSGFIINKMELLLPAGALTGVAGATGHGKTDFLINTALNTVRLYPDKVFYFFTYEMSQEAILMRVLNTYLNMDLEAVSNTRALKYYYKTGSIEFIKKEVRESLVEKSKEFFKNIIETGRLRVKGINYNSQELNSALYDITKNIDNIGGFYIDYLQLLKLSKEGYRNYSRQEEVKTICQDLHTTAKDIQLPVILGAQFNREVTTPLKLHATNIGEAGDIERVLDTLIGIWYTNKPLGERPVKKDEEEISKKTKDKKDKLYTVILKSRETSSDPEELLNYNAKRGLITNDSSTNNYFER